MVADRCIRQSRRDPRDSASAEQALYDQLEDALESAAKGKTVDLLSQTPPTPTSVSYGTRTEPHSLNSRRPRPPPSRSLTRSSLTPGSRV